MKTITKATPDDIGTWIDSSRGHYAHVALIQRALDCGMPDNDYQIVVDDYYASGGTGDHCEFSVECADEALEWLNDNVAAEGYLFDWFEGDVQYQPISVWESELWY